MRQTVAMRSPLKNIYLAVFKFTQQLGLNKSVLEENGDGPPERYRRVLNEKVNVTSNKRGFRTNNHSVTNSEQVTLTMNTLNYERRVLLLPKAKSRE